MSFYTIMQAVPTVLFIGGLGVVIGVGIYCLSGLFGERLQDDLDNGHVPDFDDEESE